LRHSRGTAPCSELAPRTAPGARIAAADPSRTRHLDWIAPVARGRIAQGGKSILFPASALARKGTYAMREALQGLDLDVIVAGRAQDHEGDFRRGVRARPLEGAEWPCQLAAVVLPALVEHEPRPLLKTLAHGLPVIATEECGLGDVCGLTTVPVCDAQALRNVIIATTNGCFA